MVSTASPEGLNVCQKRSQHNKNTIENISRYRMTDKKRVSAKKTVITASRAKQTTPTGATEIDIDLIIEDIHQPRKEFNQDTLRELTETVKLRGVKSPISVRPNPDKPGTYIINHGARR